MVTAVKHKFGYDDSLDAFGVHGAGGTLGAILTGVFATKEINDVRNGKAMGLVDGNSAQVLNQLASVAIAWVLAAVGTFIHPEDLRRDHGRARRRAAGDRGSRSEHARRRRI